MLQQTIRTGFYKKGQQQRLAPDELCDLLAESFRFSADGAGYSAVLFLHGFCDIFALALQKTFSYKLFQVSENGQAVHTFAIAQYNSKSVYIDARGITSRYEDMTCAFDAFFASEENKHIILPFKEDKEEPFPEKTSAEFFDAALRFIEKYKDYYDIAAIEKQTVPSPKRKPGFRKTWTGRNN